MPRECYAKIRGSRKPLTVLRYLDSFVQSIIGATDRRNWSAGMAGAGITAGIVRTTIV